MGLLIARGAAPPSCPTEAPLLLPPSRMSGAEFPTEALTLASLSLSLARALSGQINLGWNCRRRFLSPFHSRSRSRGLGNLSFCFAPVFTRFEATPPPPLMLHSNTQLPLNQPPLRGFEGGSRGENFIAAQIPSSPSLLLPSLAPRNMKLL